MILNPLDFKINLDLIYLKLGVVHTHKLRSTAKIDFNIYFSDVNEHILDHDDDTIIFEEET